MDLTSLSAGQLAQKIACKECGAREALDAHLERVTQFNSAINAVISSRPDFARERAAEADEATARGVSWGPLHGVPITVKDTYDTAGLRTSIGIPWLTQHIPESDADLVKRLVGAGAIVWGKTNLPIASTDWNANHPIHGPCRNPWNLSHGPGGSSGGSAAALAAQFTPLEIGSDVAGSIRHPAHCCGVYGLRATEGLLSKSGHANVPGTPNSLRSHLSLGPLARDPNDIALILPHLFEHSSLAGQRVMQTAANADLAGARIAWTLSWGGVPVCDDTRRVLENLLEVLRDAGAQVEEVELPFDLESILDIYGITHGFEYGAMLPHVARSAIGRRFMRHVYLPIVLGRGCYARRSGRGFTAGAQHYFTALEKRERAIEAFDEWFKQWDLWVTPVAATTAFPISRINHSVKVGPSRVKYCDVVGMFNCPTAVTGHPVMAVPAGVSNDGLPIGMQIHGRRWSDRQLVQYACEIARRLPKPQLPDLSRLDSAK